ncbi:hypothetical protein H6F77_20450 [Microcoleus sp. FACHB-831]|uniref:hypothetical protein n=1 Tax=Microcoleus sp. FACHB-831 TaxID=2692827 RepID=UPI0016820AB9|nr:hypothetical protein [Microcoleus sp. FACHB-831]MBD1923423.1 hypothetical protein [Microcoleus sp. FACHB-831]
MQLEEVQAVKRALPSLGKPGLQLEEVQAVKRSLPSLVEGGVLTLTILVSQALAAQKRDRIYRKTELVAVTVKV